MDRDKLLKYHEYLEQLIEAMTTFECMEIDRIYLPLAELCKLFGVSKGVTKFFKTPAYEKSGQGETFVCYDNGQPGEPVYSRRIVTTSMTVAVCMIYRPEGSPPFDEEENRKIDLIMRTVLTYLTRNRLESIIEKLTFNDENGYPNTRSFMRYISQQHERGCLSKYAAIRFNLRHFSLINQEIGRRYGDIVIRKYFDLIDNTIGDRGIICRIGGDNFGVVVEKPLLGKILDIFSGTPVIYDLNRTKRIMVSAYAGVFEIPDDFPFERPGDIMDRIVLALQLAKNGRKESTVFFSTMNIADKEKRMRVQQSFPLAMKNREFKAYYQPKINIETGEMIGAEALCRWLHEGEVVPPVEFIPILEQSTDICALDFYMLNEVCGDIRRWLDEGRNVVRISVNLSRKHMMDIDLLERIKSIISSNNVPPEYIEIELTETTTDVEFRDLKRVVNGLQEAGIYTSVDDFGMGYSSLNLIREIPWNVLKVDRSFLPVAGDDQESNRSIMFKYVVAMAQEMGLECIAEGVETREQIDILKANQCSLAQGFFFDKPLPVGDFENKLDEHKYEI